MPGEGSEVGAYVFMHVLDPGTSIPGVVESFGSKEGVRWAQHVVGSSVVFGAVTVSSLQRLQELIVGRLLGGRRAVGVVARGQAEPL